jgi:hypothetical protein
MVTFPSGDAFFIGDSLFIITTEMYLTSQTWYFRASQSSVAFPLNMSGGFGVLEYWSIAITS